MKKKKLSRLPVDEVDRKPLPLSAIMHPKLEITKAATIARMLNHALLSKAAETRLARRIRAGDEAAMHELVRHNLRLAVFVAQRFADCHPNLNRDDLSSEAVLALYHAARKFNPRRGRFARYAGFYVREALRLALNVTRFGQRHPPPRKDRDAATGAAWHWLEETGRDASIDQLATMLGWKRSRVQRALAGTRTISLNAPLASDGRTLGDMLEDNSAPRADAHVTVSDTASAVRAAVIQLEPRARMVIQHRFGLTLIDDASESHREIRGKNPCALRAVGAVIGLTGERTRQIERAALLTLRRLLADHGQSANSANELRDLEAGLLCRFERERIVAIDSYAESGLWFAAHRLAQRGVLRPGPCANTWALARAEEKSELRLTA